MRRLLWLIPVVALFGVAGAALFSSRPTATLGQPAPVFSLPRLDDPTKQAGSTQLKGKRAVINFWGSWCEVCKDEAPEFASSSARHPEVAFLGVDMADGREEAKRFVSDYGINYPNVVDERSKVSKAQFGVLLAPETIFLDERGIVVGHYYGAFKPGALERVLARLAQLKNGEILTFAEQGDTRPIP